jgi:hypothetical protein
VLRRTALAAILALCVVIPAQAADSILLTWDPNPSEEQVLGYRVYVATQYGEYTQVYDVGTQTSFEYLNAVAGQQYFFAVAAYDILGYGPWSEMSGFSNAPPSLANPGEQRNAVGQPVALQLNGSDIYGEPVSYGLIGVLPPGLTLNESTGRVSGAATTAGFFDVTVTVTDGLLSTSQEFLWYIDESLPAVTITSPTTLATYSASGGSVTLGGTAGDDLGVVSVTWVNNRGGAGDALGTTNWTVPTVLLLPGENVITLTAHDTAGLTTAAVITVTSPGGPLPLVAITVPTAGPSYSTNADSLLLGGMANDSAGVTSVTWAIENGASGTAIVDAGQSFTTWFEPDEVPLMLGVNVITVTAWNALDQSGSSVLTVTRSHSPTLLNPGNRTSPEGSVVFLQLEGSDLDGDLLTYTAEGLPAGLTLNTASGEISGTVLYTAAGVWSATLGVSDNLSTTFASVIWTVPNTDRPPVVTNPGPLTSFPGVGVTMAAPAVDPDGDPMRFTAVNLPPGITINWLTGAISGTPTTLGVFSVVITASAGGETGQAFFSWSIVSPLPGKAVPVSPSGSIATTTPAFSWTADGTAAYYALSVSDASAGGLATVVWFTPSGAGCPLGGTCTVPAPRSLTSGLVSWAVITWNPYGYGPWSTTRTAVVEIGDAAVPTPVPGAPSGPIATRTPSYTWSAISNASWYQFSVSDALGVVREFWYSPSQACVSTSCSATPNVLLAIGPAQWTVRAWRTSGAGAWTAPRTFEATDSVPGTATLVSPLSPVTTVTPSFTWNAVLGTSYYLLRVIDRDNVTVDRWYLPAAVGCPLGAGTCVASPGVALKAGAATWRVLTWNGSGYGPWSAPRDFLVEIADSAALEPSAVSPTGTIVSANVPYQWTGVAGAISYRLSIQNNGGAPVYWWFTSAAAGCAATTECSAFPQAALLNGTAQWQVQAWTTTGYGPWSPPVALTVNIPAPPRPTLVSPSGTAGASPAFRWNAAASATLYYIRAYDPTGLRVDKWLTPSQVGCASGGMCTLNAGVTLTSGAGSWQVLAWNPSGYSPWSSTLAFVVP